MLRGRTRRTIPAVRPDGESDRPDVSRICGRNDLAPEAIVGHRAEGETNSTNDGRVLLRAIVNKIRSEECDCVTPCRPPGQEIGNERADQLAMGCNEPSVHGDPAQGSVQTSTAIHQPGRGLHERGFEPFLISQRAKQRMNALMEIEVRRFSFVGHLHHPGDQASHEAHGGHRQAGLAAHVRPFGIPAGRTCDTTRTVGEKGSA